MNYLFTRVAYWLILYCVKSVVNKYMAIVDSRLHSGAQLTVFIVDENLVGISAVMLVVFY